MKASTTLIGIILTTTTATSLLVASADTSVKEWTSEVAVVATTVTPVGSRRALIEAQRSDHPGIHGADPASKARIQAGIDLYAEAGLELPEIRIYVHDSTARCRGWAGLFNTDHSGFRVDLCHEPALVHELAHVWEYHNVDDATRQPFMEHVGAATWNDKTVDHDDRGVELIADVIASGVRDPQITPRLADTLREHIELYELATGRPSPRIADLPTHSTP